MATNWPTSRDTFTNPSSSSTLDSPSHAAQHANINDAVEAMQLYAGLVLVKSQTIGSGVSSVTVTGAFSSTFQNYRIVVMVSGVSGTSGIIAMQMGSTTSGYRWGRFQITAAGASSGSGDAAASYFYACAADAAQPGAATIDLYRPNEAAATIMHTNYLFARTSTANALAANFGGGVLNDTTQYTAFTISAPGQTMDGGSIRVYGYNNG